MSKCVYVIKNKLDSQIKAATGDIKKYAEESLKRGKSRFYNGKKTNISLDQSSEAYIMIIDYINKGEYQFNEKNELKSDIKEVFVGKVKNVKQKSNDEFSIEYEMIKCITDSYVICNLLDDLDINVTKDYDDNTYIMVSHLDILVKKISEFMIGSDMQGDVHSYALQGDCFKLANYAQHNNQCRRMLNLCVEEDRSEFQRDRERIVNSKAFRRMVDKAQIFSANKGDHYRTRMTHTLEVNQIAKAIAIALNLNLDLTEAIALGHDIGHTPFGHQGERTLYNILTAELEKNFKLTKLDIEPIKVFGGFRHNAQSVRVLTKIENKYVQYPGLDISIQTLEGILKHTEVKNVCLKEILGEKICKELGDSAEKCSMTMEGQVVFIADEIAQRGHDIDDAITSGLIDSSEFLSGLHIEKFKDIYDVLEESLVQIEEMKRIYIDKKELIVGRFVSNIVGYLIKDVIKTTKKLITEKKNIVDSSEKLKEQIVRFSDVGKSVSDYLERFVNKKVINNAEVAGFDYTGDNIIKELFYAYYKNPKLLHYGTLRKIYADTRMHGDTRVSSSAIDMTQSNLNVLNHEIDEISREMIDLSQLGTDKMYVRFEKRKILVSNIVDYISGMTDSYAQKEYAKLRS